MPFGKIVHVRSFGYGVCLAELVPAEKPLPEGVTAQEVEAEVRKACYLSSSGEMQLFDSCRSVVGRQVWAVMYSHGEPTGPMEIGQLDEEAALCLAEVAGRSPSFRSRVGMVLSAAEGQGHIGTADRRDSTGSQGVSGSEDGEQTQ